MERICRTRQGLRAAARAHNDTWADWDRGIDWRPVRRVARGRYPAGQPRNPWADGRNKFEGSRICAMNLKKLSAAAAYG